MVLESKLLLQNLASLQHAKSQNYLELQRLSVPECRGHPRPSDEARGSNVAAAFSSAAHVLILRRTRRLTQQVLQVHGHHRLHLHRDQAHWQSACLPAPLRHLQSTGLA